MLRAGSGELEEVTGAVGRAICATDTLHWVGELLLSEIFEGSLLSELVEGRIGVGVAVV